MPAAAAKRKRSVKSEPAPEDWDDLPHGMGKTGDLENPTDDVPVSKRTRRGNVQGSFPSSKSSGKSEDSAEPLTPDSSVSVLLDPPLPNSAAKKGRGAKNVKSEVKSEDTASGTESGTAGADVKLEDIEEKPKKKQARRKTLADVKDEDVAEKPKRKRTPRKAPSIDTSAEVAGKADELIAESGKVPKKVRKKAHPYGLTPGASPFPDHIKPTAEDCEEVVRVLSKVHGEVNAPKEIPAPSMEVTGCGEVPDLLDALLRTLLSATTTARNANLSLAGLNKTFGLRTSGLGKGSINWEAVHEADLKDVIEAIKQGGLAVAKGNNIKKILAAVHDRNLARRDALLEEKKTGKPADIPGAKHETQAAKDIELARFNEGLLSMDHIFELTTDEAMDEMTKLPGIGVKTASCAILFCMKRPSFAVDTHVWRHCKWLGWVPPNATRDKTFSHCEVRIPNDLKYTLHYLFLKHGKSCGRCKAGTSVGSEEWENADCPIEHLVNRTEAKKQVGYSSPKKSTPGKKGAPSPKTKGKKGKRSKNIESETEESEVEMSDEVSENLEEESDQEF